MSRFNGDEFYEEFANQGLMWEANRTRHLCGAKGQAVLRELRDALIELPEHRLIASRLADESGCVCTVGALARHRGVPTQELAELVKPGKWGDVDSYDAELATTALGARLGLKEVMSITLSSINDDIWFAPTDETPEERYERVLRWVESKIQPEPVAA